MRIEGEKILCLFRKMSGPHVIAGTGKKRILDRAETFSTAPAPAFQSN